MRTYYTRYYHWNPKTGVVHNWIRWPLVRVTMTRIKEVERVSVANNQPIPRPLELGCVEMQTMTTGDCV